MKVCIRCEAEIPADADVCPKCGRNQNRPIGEQAELDDHTGGYLLFVLVHVVLPAVFLGGLGYALGGIGGAILGAILGPALFSPFSW